MILPSLIRYFFFLSSSLSDQQKMFASHTFWFFSFFVKQMGITSANLLPLSQIGSVVDSMVCSPSPSLSNWWLGFVLWRLTVLWWWVWYGYFAWWVYSGLWWCWFTGSMIFFFTVGLLVVVVCSAVVVEWGCWGFLFCFDFLLWVLWLICG